MIHKHYWQTFKSIIGRFVDAILPVVLYINVYNAFALIQNYWLLFIVSLPRQRINIERPFVQCNVDFCGKLLIGSEIQCVTSVRPYISVFVCLVNRAIHLELVSSFSTDAFLATLTKFISCRGPYSHKFSNNGKMFLGQIGYCKCILIKCMQLTHF